MNPNEIYSIVKNQIIDYDRFEQHDIRVIAQSGVSHDTCISKIMTYREWMLGYATYPVIKVEGIEKVITTFPPFKIKDIHLFVNQKFGQSFKWHKDNTDVYLYVLRGFKRLYVRDKVYNLYPGQGCIIPKGHTHKAVSNAGTWALSIGY